jgi:RimJ/RimL family protein N-acetyltransferase
MEIETDRLRMLPFEPGDAGALHRLWTLPEVRRHLWGDRIIAPEEAVAQIAASMACFDEDGFGFWTIRTKEVPALVGFCGLRRFGEPPAVEILYGLDPDYWGLGLATEAACAVLRFGFETCGVGRIYAGADAPNAASFRVMERLGMERAERIDDGGSGPIYYSVSRARFRPSESYFAVRRNADE